MSLARTALRLAAVEALCPTAALAADGPWQTLAQKYVFDSRINPIEDDLKVGEDRPIICVYTEHDDGKSGQGRGGPPFLLTIDLVLELSIVVKIAKDGDPENFIVGEPETDPELEAALDLLEAQIKFILLYAAPGRIWREVSKSRVHNPRSTIHRTSEEGIRLAKRTMTWKVEVEDDQYEAAPKAPLKGFAILPWPLRTVAEMLPEGSYGRKVCLGLAAEMTVPVMPIAVPIETVTLNVKVMDPSTGTLPATPNLVAEVDNLQS
jgi:hypothetical protein